MASPVGKAKHFAISYVDTFGVLGVAGAKADPSALTFSWEIVSAAGAVLAGPTAYVWQTDAQLVRDAVGDFHVVVVPTFPGTFRWKWVTPPNSAFPDVTQGSFLVVPQLF